MERSIDRKGRHMLQSTTTKDTPMSTLYSSCQSLESVSPDSCSHGLKGKQHLSMLIMIEGDISGKRSILTLMWCIEILWTRDQPLDCTEFRVLTLLRGHTMCCHREKSQKKIISEQRENLWQEEGAAISLDLRRQFLESPDLSCLCPWGSL